MNLHFWLRVAHGSVLATVLGLSYLAWKTNQYKNPKSKLWVYMGSGVFLMLVFGVVVHRICGVKTKLGHTLHLNDRPNPKFMLY